jgi:mono/diheme cytochrome c family protein
MGRLLPILALAAGVLGLAACAGTQKTTAPQTVIGTLQAVTAAELPPGDPAAGAAVFESAGCGGCHTLSAAGSTGNVGPNLDDTKPEYALAIDRVTNGMGVMPSFSGQLSEQQISDVAAYVVDSTGGQLPAGGGGGATTEAGTTAGATTEAGTTAGATTEAGTTAGTTTETETATTEGGGSTAGGEGDAAAGKKVFASAGCTGCHTLADAGSTGNVGPNLDDANPPFERVLDRVTNGKGVMPSFKDQLSEQQIKDVATYVSQVAGS